MGEGSERESAFAALINIIDVAVAISTFFT
jgi:hypothetical protein